MKKAVIYARYSSHSQRDESIDAQLRECHNYAQRNDYMIIEEYCDRALTGKNDNRAAFQKMIKDARNNKFNYVLVYKLDRFARNRYDSAMYKNMLKKHNIKVVSIMENIGDSPEGIILESVLEGMAEYYSANLSQNIKRGMTENALQCKFNGSGYPLGYTITPDKHYAVDPIGAKVVNEIYEMYARGRTVSEIMEYCNNKGYKTVKGGEFNKNSFRTILTNEKYIGTYRHGDVVVENGIPAIVDRELYDKVQAMVKANYTARAKGKAKIDYLLSGKVFCGHCGTRMNGDSGTSKTGAKKHYYLCNKKKMTKQCDKTTESKDWLENTVVKITVEKVLTDENIELIATRAMEILNMEYADTSMLEYYEKELQETRKQIKNIVDMIAKGIASVSIAERLTELENYEKDVLENIEYEKIKKPVLTKEQIIFWLESFRHGDTDDVEYKRRIIDTLVHSVYVYDTDDGGRRFVVNFNTSTNNVSDTKVFGYSESCSTKNAVTEHLIVSHYTMFTYVVEIKV